MKILVTGAGGFIGSAIIEGLLGQGHEIVACARRPNNLPGSAALDFRASDLNHMTRAADWLPLLGEVNAVVNCAGILRESKAGDFERIHHHAPLALAEACRRCGIGRFVQISALGVPDDGEFVASKHRFDQALQGMLPTAWVLRPSVVVSTRGSYGGTSMLRALAAVPMILVLPAGGAQRIQPILLEDLAEAVSLAVAAEPGQGGMLEAVGPEVLNVADYLRAVRAWLKLKPARFEVSVPGLVVAAGARVGDLLRAGPMGSTLWRMLQRGNVAAVDASQKLDNALTVQPRAVTDCLASSASFVQDRWHAYLYLLRPLVWMSLVTIWLVSALSGLLAGPLAAAEILGAMGLASTWHSPLVMATSALNLVLGLMLLARLWIRPVLWLMLLSVLGYTLGLALLVPGLWLELSGGLVKNLAVMVTVLVALALEDLR